MRAFVRDHLPTVLWALLTGVALLLPGSELESLGSWPDWVPSAGHFLLFFGLVILLDRSLRAARRPGPLVTALLAALLYGLLLEIAQIGVVGREFELLDLALNTLGALVGVAGRAVVAGAGS